MLLLDKPRYTCPYLAIRAPGANSSVASRLPGTGCSESMGEEVSLSGSGSVRNLAQAWSSPNIALVDSVSSSRRSAVSVFLLSRLRHLIRENMAINRLGCPVRCPRYELMISESRFCAFLYFWRGGVFGLNFSCRSVLTSRMYSNGFGKPEVFCYHSAKATQGIKHDY